MVYTATIVKLSLSKDNLENPRLYIVFRTNINEEFPLEFNLTNMHDLKTLTSLMACTFSNFTGCLENKFVQVIIHKSKLAGFASSYKDEDKVFPIRRSVFYSYFPLDKEYFSFYEFDELMKDILLKIS